MSVYVVPLNLQHLNIACLVLNRFVQGLVTSQTTFLVVAMIVILDFYIPIPHIHASFWASILRFWLPVSDKIRQQYVRRKDKKYTIRRYIVLLPEEKADSCQRDSKLWRVMGACTYSVIDDPVTSIGNAFDRGSARIGEITFLRTCPF